MGSKLLNYRRNLSSVFSSLSSFSPFSFLQILCWISVLIKLIIKKGGKRRNFILGNFFSKKKKTRKNPNFTSLTLSMEFWGAEVKSGQNFEIELEDDGSRILHLSQVALGEGTGDNKKVKAKETICLYLKFKNEKFLVGTLSQEKCPQIALDLVLHDKFELSHTRKNGSVYVTGYYVGTSQGSDTESEEDLLEPTMNLVQSVPAASDPTTTEQVTIVSSDKDEESSEEQEPRLLVNGENDSDDADSDEDDSDDADCDYHPDIDDADGNEDDGEEDSSDEDKKTPEKVMIYTKQVTIVSSDEDEESSEEQEPRMLVNGENDSDDADSDEDDGEEDSSDEDQKTPEKEPRMLVNGENDSDDADSDEDDSDDADCDYHPDIDDADGNEDDGEEDSSDEDKKTPEKVMIYTKQVTIVSSDEDEESSEEQEPRMLVNGENDSDDADSDEDDGEEDSSDEDQKTPEKAGPSRKRPAMSSMKTPAAPKKKAKLVTPQKTGRFSLPSLPL
ncbi:histone deacetylase HDT3-like isoform X4 [Gossypium raimondii]|uniref:histone deacetylase HDT3-like isoform X3 n=1 Tax=Gossypium raimondii TaxID=29730 RepID=UPI00227ACD8A|nr:histone deacetylase HDT3-like isoform X3 [Gossypium raimondii]XP_052476282.1 histone deacetylase HDT3-like isoform X4 [Gossypium raimondii]